MKKEVITIDWYTKIILTVIAICLLAVVFRPILVSKGVKANPETLKVDIVKVGGYRTFGSTLDVNIDEIGGGYVGYGGPIKVEGN